jgi:hypothetical protein
MNPAQLAGALKLTTSTPGWQQVLTARDEILKRAITAVLVEENAAVRADLATQAKAMQDGFTSLFRYVEESANYVEETPNEQDSEWSNIS